MYRSFQECVQIQGTNVALHNVPVSYDKKSIVVNSMPSL